MSPPKKKRCLLNEAPTTDVNLTNVTSRHFLGNTPRRWMDQDSPTDTENGFHEPPERHKMFVQPTRSTEVQSLTDVSKHTTAIEAGNTKRAEESTLPILMTIDHEPRSGSVALSVAPDGNRDSLRCGIANAAVTTSDETTKGDQVAPVPSDIEEDWVIHNPLTQTDATIDARHIDTNATQKAEPPLPVVKRLLNNSDMEQRSSFQSATISRSKNNKQLSYTQGQANRVTDSMNHQRSLGGPIDSNGNDAGPKLYENETSTYNRPQCSTVSIDADEFVLPMGSLDGKKTHRPLITKATTYGITQPGVSSADIQTTTNRSPLHFPGRSLHHAANGAAGHWIPNTPPPPYQDARIKPAENVRVSIQLPMFDFKISNLRAQIHFDMNMERRVNLVRTGLGLEDLFFLLFHQIFCLWTVDRIWVRGALEFDLVHEAGFKFIANIALPNRQIDAKLIELFAGLINSRQMLQHDGHMRTWIRELKHFLKGLERRWESLEKLCFSMTVPPSAFAAAYFLGCLNSSVLQGTAFLTIFGKLYPETSADFHTDVVQLFLADQEQFLQTIRARNMTIRAGESVQKNMQLFGSRFEQLRQKHQFSSPSTCNARLLSVTSRNAKSGIAATQSKESSSSLLNAISPGQPILGRTPFIPVAFAGSRQDSHTTVQHAHPQPEAHLLKHTFETAGNRSTSGHESDLQSFRPIAGNQNTLAGCLGAPVADDMARSPSQLTNDTTTMQHVQPALIVFETFIIKPILMDSERSYKVQEFEVLPHLLPQQSGMALQHSMESVQKSDGQGPISAMSFQLRCIELSEEDDAFSERLWHCRSTRWPKCCFFSINSHHIDHQRTIRHGTEISVEVTDLIRNKNRMEVSYFPTSSESEVRFSFAVEVVKRVDYATAASMPEMIGPASSLKTITETIQDPGNGEKGKASTDQCKIIEILDPVTSKLCDRPVRGKNCTHLECFDLGTFLKSHVHVSETGSVRPDDWMCPICKNDATPTNLIVDGFLMAVSKQLQRANMFETRAILVKQDGSWEPKTTKADQRHRHHTVDFTPPTRIAGQETESIMVVAELDKDDCVTQSRSSHTDMSSTSNAQTVVQTT